MAGEIAPDSRLDPCSELLGAQKAGREGKKYRSCSLVLPTPTPDDWDEERGEAVNSRLGF